jgi:ATP-dependent DNA helicase RecG
MDFILNNLLDNKIEFLKGVGPKRAAILNKELNIYTYNDLLNYFPFRHIDKSRIYNVTEIDNDNIYYQIAGRIDNIKSFGSPRLTRITANLTDETGTIELVWFKGLKWIKTRFLPNQKYLLFGKASSFNNKFNFVHPDIEDFNPDDFTQGESLQGVYNTTEMMKTQGLGTKSIAKLVKTLLFQVKESIQEVFPKYILEKETLISRSAAYFNIHLPSDPHQLQLSVNRLKFEEHFFFQLQLLHNKKNRELYVKGYPFKVVGKYFNDFYANHLPFPLTNAQKRVIREIRQDLGAGTQMNRLLQGDVGSGKTIVALMVMLIALDNGFQAALMAPTEILAAQHLDTIQKLLENMPVEIALLTGSTKARQRKIIHEGLQSSKLQILIGTHALIEENVQFKQLGITVIDEQHRFGVAQRARMQEKHDIPPHILVMTATPIPRTLAMTQYGDLNNSRIDEMPPGRKMVETRHLYQNQRLQMIGFLKKQIGYGRQIYIVYPLIRESEKLDLINLMEGYESLLRDFPEPDYRICMVHGQMKAADKDFEMQRFVKGQAHIMVATTVIEVGVNIPNASVMVIEHADRFGLSQLHQLRGRVGRGADQSYCLLMTDFKLTAEAKRRMATMVRTNDGFEIAEVDLQLRGPGETQGTRQSGQIEFKLGNLLQDEKLIKYVRHLVNQILDDDPQLLKPDNQILKSHFEKIFKKTFDWSRIS